MPDRVEEKLVELLGNIYLPMMCGPDTIGEYRIPHKFKKEIASHLIANGVTVQEWISVKDRLPEDDSNVLAYLPIGEEGRIYPANYAKGVWWDCIFNTPAQVTTHWMPLPQPPKGEQ